MSFVEVTVSGNAAKLVMDGEEKYRAKETFPGKQEGEGYTGWVIQKGCEVYFNTEKKVSGMEFNSNFYDSNSSKYYYAHLSIDYSPVSVTLPTVE